MKIELVELIKNVEEKKKKIYSTQLELARLENKVQKKKDDLNELSYDLHNLYMLTIKNIINKEDA